jgi:hypothetical protein
MRLEAGGPGWLRDATAGSTSAEAREFCIRFTSCCARHWRR